MLAFTVVAKRIVLSSNQNRSFPNQPITLAVSGCNSRQRHVTSIVDTSGAGNDPGRYAPLYDSRRVINAANKCYQIRQIWRHRAASDYGYRCNLCVRLLVEY